MAREIWLVEMVVETREGQHGREGAVTLRSDDHEVLGCDLGGIVTWHYGTRQVLLPWAVIQRDAIPTEAPCDPL